MAAETMRWLLESDEPWTSYRAFVDLLDRSDRDPELGATARNQVLSLRDRHGFPKAQVPLRLVRHFTRRRCAEPFPVRSKRRPVLRDGQGDRVPGRQPRPLHGRFDVPGLEGLVLRRQKSPLAVAHVSGLADS